jgi:hypothetical protein
MDQKTDESRDLIGTIGRCINTLRDAFLTALIVFGAFVLWDLWPAYQQQLKTARIETVSLGAVTVKLGSETVASFQSNNLTINAVGGSADISEKGSLQDLTQGCFLIIFDPATAGRRRAPAPATNCEMQPAWATPRSP